MSEKKEHIVRRPQNLREHYYPKHRTLPYKSPVVAWTSEKCWIKQGKSSVEGIRLQPLSRRFTINHFMVDKD